MLSIVSGILGLLFASGFLSWSAHDAATTDASHSDDFRMTVGFVLLALGAVALLVIGIGQLRYRRWAYWATLIWSGAALLIAAASLITIQTLTDESLNVPNLTLAYAALFVPYPATQLLLFLSGTVKGAMVR